MATNGFDKNKERATKAGRNSRRGRSWKTVYQEILDSKLTIKNKNELKGRGVKVSDGTFHQAIAAAMAHKAMSGNVPATRLITETMEGTKSHNTMAGDPDNPIEYVVTWPGDKKR